MRSIFPVFTDPCRAPTSGCCEDASLTLETQDRMASTANADEVIGIDAGHMVMISRPEALADVLNITLMLTLGG